MTGVTIRTRRDGTQAFEAQVSRPRVNGKPQSPLAKTFPTYEQAQRWRDDTLAARRATPTTAPHTFRTWTQAYLSHALHLSPAARRYNQIRMELHVFPAIGDMPLTEILPSDISALLAKMLIVRAHPTVSRVRVILAQILTAAVREKLITTNPADDIRLPRRTTPQREIQAWTRSQIDAFLAYPTTQASPLLTLFTVAFDTGARRGELLGLIPDDIRPGKLLIRRSLHADGTVGLPKTAKGTRRVRLSPRALAALQQQRMQRESTPCDAPQLWLTPEGEPLSPSRVSVAFQVLVDEFVASPQGKALGAPRITLHGARHSWVSNRLANGEPLATVSREAGHASAAFTADRYHHVLDDLADELEPELYGQASA